MIIPISEPDGDASTDLVARCERLRRLHVPGEPLVLANAWDAATARAVEAAEFPAVATTSAGVAAACGFGDHEKAPQEVMLAAAGRIVQAVGVPVSVDVEAGYGLPAAELVRLLQRCGAAGINIEDSDHRLGGIVPVEDQVEWLRRIRSAANRRNYPLVVNARIDVLLIPDRRPNAALIDDAIERATAYLHAGADCVFPFLLQGSDARRAMVAAVGSRPVNVLTWPGDEDPAALAADGIARLSFGSTLHNRVLHRFSKDLVALASNCSWLRIGPRTEDWSHSAPTARR